MARSLDTVEDFSMLDIRQRMRRSRLLPFISDPVDSSFRQIGGYQYETTFEPPPAVARSRSISIDSRHARESMEKPPSRMARGMAAPWPTRRSSFDSDKLSMPDMTEERYRKHSLDSISIRSASKLGTPSLTLDTQNITFAGERRVLVRYRHGRAPTLLMKRLSGLLQSIPSPLTSEGSHSIASPLSSPDTAGASRSALIPLPTDAFSEDPPQSYATAFTDSPLVGIGLPDRGRIRPATRRTLPANSELNDMNIAAARRSSMVFPPRQSLGAPLRSGGEAQLADLHALAMQPSSTVASSFAETYGTTLGETTLVSRSASSRTVNSQSGVVRRGSSVKRKPVPQYENLDSAIAKMEAMSAAESEFAPLSNDKELSPLEQSPPPLPVSAPSSRTKFSDRSQGRRAKSLAGRRPQMSFVTQGHRSTLSQSSPVQSAPSSRINFSWVPDTEDIAADGYAELDEAWERMGLKRIKSIGIAPRRRTPIPSQSTFSRGSMAAQWDDETDIVDMLSSSV
ncbi:hypothetical protein EIP86_001612 [Pleurotus ostreatoroseus]|nr:hypothetical protein EIP86_001612 [Pleurotus ostreatoroseus]